MRETAGVQVVSLSLYLWAPRTIRPDKMNTEYHDQERQPIIFQRGTTLAALVTGVAALVLIAGCSGGDGGRQTPPASPSPTPSPNPPPPAPQNLSGLDARPSNTTCVAPERA